MANNPKLNVYTLRLKPKNDSLETFRDLFKQKFMLDVKTTDDEVFKKYVESFVNGIGDKEFRKDERNKKVLGTVDSNNTALLPIRPHMNTYIDGVIEGGKYGIRREYADTDKKEDKKVISANSAVLDKYYILLYTPLNSLYGFLLAQSYTEESIQDSLKNYITNFFSCEDFYNIVIEPFVPQQIIDKYMTTSSIRMFSYTKTIKLSDILRDDKQVKGQEFEVEIKLKPLGRYLDPSSDDTQVVLEELGEKYFDDFKLNSCQKKRAYVSDSHDRKAHYDLEKEIKQLRPTIYLEDAGIIPDEKTGLPDFCEIQKYCIALLEDIKKEFNSNSDIYEH